jgi:putative hydrolase of the HAD superfamily
LIPAGRDRYGYFDGGERGYWLRFARRTMEKAAGRPIPDSMAEKALKQLGKAFMQPDAWVLYPDVRPALEALSAGSVRLGIVSNWDSRLPKILDFFGLQTYFDTVVVSHFEGIEKPDPALFRIALKRLGAAPRETLHVGDRPDLDLDGARSAGLDAILIDRRGRYGGAFEALPDLAGLPALII